MDTRELFTGAYVFDGTSIAQVTGITCDGIVETTRNPKSNIGLIEPIPLTEDFFKKNGFAEDNSFYPLYKKYENEDKRIIITDEANSGDGYWYVHVDNEDYDTVGGCDIRYVHQFQQLLWLCGYKIDVVV